LSPLFPLRLPFNVPVVQKSHAIRSATNGLAAPLPPGSTRKLGLRQGRSPRHRLARDIQPGRRLLWIDDYEPGLMVYQAIFAKLGFRVITALRPAIGLQLASSQHVDAVITDYEMPEMNGASVAAVLKRRDPELPVILFSGTDSLLGQSHPADACCDKAAPLEQLLATLKRLLVHRPGRRSLQPQASRPPSEQGQRTFA